MLGAVAHNRGAAQPQHVREPVGLGPAVESPVPPFPRTRTVGERPVADLADHLPHALAGPIQVHGKGRRRPDK